MSNYQQLRRTVEDWIEISNEESMRKPRVTPMRELKSRIWLKVLEEDSDTSDADINRVYFGERRTTGTINRWYSEEHIVNPQSVTILSSICPTAAAIYHLPVFDLLDTTVSTGTIKRFQKEHTINNPDSRWAFSDKDPFTLSSHDKKRSIILEDSNGLYELGGIYGFMGIVSLLRKAELENDSARHFLYLLDAYRAFPGFCRNKYFKDYWKDFLEALTSIHWQVFSSMMLVFPKVDVIRRQIFIEEHNTGQTNKSTTTDYANTVLLEDPFEVAEFPD